MELYRTYLAALVMFNFALAYHRHHLDKDGVKEESLALPTDDGKTAARQFKWQYFGLYSMVMTADWLQVSRRENLRYTQITPANK